MTARKNLALNLFLPAALSAFIVACGDQGEEGAEEPRAVAGEVGAREVVRLPDENTEPTAQARAVDYARLARVATTDLTPGAAFIDPAIENPYAGDQEAIAAGSRHFAAFNCSGCHAPLGGGGMGPSLSDDKWIYGDEPAQIYLSIMHGRPSGMPAWSSMLTEKIVWELAAYIDTLDDIKNYAGRKGFKENKAGFRKREGERPHEPKKPSEREE